MQVEAQVEEDVMGLSDAESDEVEEEEEASNVSFSDDIGDLGDSEGEEEDSKLPPRYFRQPCSAKKFFFIFLTNLQPMTV